MHHWFSSLRRVLILGLLLVVTASCRVGQSQPAPAALTTNTALVDTSTPSPSASSTPAPSATPTPSPTQTSSPTSTPTSSPTVPLPTSTPAPSATPTPQPTQTPTAVPPTDTPVPPTDTPVPPTVTSAPPTATYPPAPPVATAPDPTATRVSEDGYLFDITMQRMLQIDENGGEIGNHNIYVHVFDAQGNPLNGVVVCRVYALRMQPPDPYACRITGESGPGRLHFDVYAGDIVYVATKDPEHRPLSPYTRSLEQEPAAMTDLQELVDNGYCADVEDCKRRIPINNLVRFHYSYEIHFTRR